MDENNEKFLFNSYNKTQPRTNFLSSDYFEAIINKNKKNFLPNQIQKYINMINRGINTLKKEDFLDGFYNKFFYENFTQEKNDNINKIKNRNELEEFPKIKTGNRRAKTKPNYRNDKNELNQKFKTNYNNNINKTNNFLNKTFNINKIKANNKKDILILTKETDDKYNRSRQSIFFPFGKISATEEKNLYIKDHNLNDSIYNITEEGKVIENKLFKKEKKKYFSGFRNKYKSLMKKNKKNIIDINEYISGKSGNKNNTQKNLLNKYKIHKIQTVLNQIQRKIKKVNHKEKMKDIIEDVKQYQQKEKDLKDKFNKTDEKFNNLIFDSHAITKRILKKFDKDYYNYDFDY